MQSRKNTKLKQPSLLRQFLEIQSERWKTKKAMRLLIKQEWSIEFLTLLLIKAANTLHQPLEMTITNTSGVSFKVTTLQDMPQNAVFKDDSIFNHLDDEMKVREFIREVNS